MDKSLIRHRTLIQFQNISYQMIDLQRTKYHHSGEAGKHHLPSVIKISISSNGASQHHVPPGREVLKRIQRHFYDIVAKRHSSDHEEASDKPRLEDTETSLCSSKMLKS